MMALSSQAAVGAQNAPQVTPAKSLSEALTAACRQSAEQLAPYLTAESAETFRALPVEQRAALMQRLVQLESAGRPLLSNDEKGRPVFRCESPGITVQMRFGETRVQENLAFVEVDAGIPGDRPGEADKAAPRRVQFGLVRESGQWKLLSVGLLLLDLPALVQEWAREDVASRENAVITAMREIARAAGTYQRAFGKLPDSLARLGPAPKEGISEEAAGLIDAELAAASKGGYKFRYRIVPAKRDAAATGDEPADGFELVATPAEYGKSGRRSFYLDSTGILRGDDKKGAVATAADASLDSRSTPH